MEQSAKGKWGEKDQEAKRRGANYSIGSKKVIEVKWHRGKEVIGAKSHGSKQILGTKIRGTKFLR